MMRTNDFEPWLRLRVDRLKKSKARTKNGRGHFRVQNALDDVENLAVMLLQVVKVVDGETLEQIERLFLH